MSRKISKGIRKIASRHPELASKLRPLYKMARQVEASSLEDIDRELKALIRSDFEGNLDEIRRLQKRKQMKQRAMAPVRGRGRSRSRSHASTIEDQIATAVEFGDMDHAVALSHRLLETKGRRAFINMLRTSDLSRRQQKMLADQVIPMNIPRHSSF